MIVPFMFGLVDPIRYLWIFEKYADFSYRNNYAIIFEEELNHNPEEFSDYKAVRTNFCPLYDFEILSLEKLSILHKAIITKQEKDVLFNGFSSEMDGRCYLASNRYDKFEELIESKLQLLEEQFGKIDAILSWVWFPSLDYCAKKRGITVIAQEFSAVRGMSPYHETMGYFNFDRRHDSKQIEKSYCEFCPDIKKQLVFSRRELLALLLDRDNLDVINRLDEATYEFGIDISMERDAFFHIYSKHSEKQILQEFSDLVLPSNVLARFHPICRPANIESEIYDIDDSPNATEWILKCKRIVSVVSNIAFDAILLGRVSYSICENMPYYFNNMQDFKWVEDSPADVGYLNFIVFGYYVPWKLMFDPEYIKWRLTNPGITEIYQYNMEYFLKSNSLNYEELLKMPPVHRMEAILKAKHKLDGQEIIQYVERVEKIPYSELIENLANLEDRVSSLENEKKQMVQHIHNLQIERENILNSTSWKITKPIRYTLDKLKKNKKN